MILRMYIIILIPLLQLAEEKIATGVLRISYLDPSVKLLVPFNFSYKIY